MKTTACFLTFLSAAALAATPPETPPASADLGRAFVTIPYSELRALWEAGQRKADPPPAPEAPPQPYLVHRAEVRIALGEAASRIDADFEVETFDSKWQRIPLLGGEARLDKADTGKRSIVWDSGYALLTNTPGRTPLVLHLAARGVHQFATPLKLTLGSAAVKRLTVTGIPAGQEARVNGQAGAVVDGAAVFLLGGDASEVSLEISAPKAEDAPPPPPQPITLSHWQAQSQVLVRFTEGRLHFAARVYARADDGSGLETTLALPANAGTIAIVAEDLAEWTQSRAEDGRRLLRLRWKTRDVLDRDALVTYAVPQSPLAEQWVLQAPAVPDEKEARSLYAVIPAEGLELKGDGLRAAVESRRLPEWMRDRIGGASFVTAEAGVQLVLQTHWLPSIATAEAIVSEAKAGLRLVPDGATQTAMSYTIKHRAPLAWRLELPEKVELLSCTVGGTAAQPVQRENGVIELSLPPSEKGATTVVLVYTAQLKPLDPVSGSAALELPRTPLFIEHLDWSVALPATFEVTAIDGNVSVSSAATPPVAGELGIALRKDFCRAERPAVSLFYQRRNLEK
jgi:hypothetical protein